ncbi:MAG: OmpA family protein [Rhizobacter sp.]|nr:OmpA family protein [Chlorobiales bacterium]
MARVVRIERDYSRVIVFALILLLVGTIWVLSRVWSSAKPMDAAYSAKPETLMAKPKSVAAPKSTKQIPVAAIIPKPVEKTAGDQIAALLSETVAVASERPAAVTAPATSLLQTKMIVVHFRKEYAALKQTEKEKLMAEFAKQLPSGSPVSYKRIEISGFADSHGEANYNLRLSMRRAKQVEAALAEMISGDGGKKMTSEKTIFAAQGFGEDARYLVEKDGKEDAASSRRVEIRAEYVVASLR